jgi:uncharacterized protein
VGLIYLDSCILIYLAEHHPRWTRPVTAAVRRAGDSDFAISPLVKCECLAAPLKRGDPILERAYQDMFERFITLTMPEAVYLQAAELRARFDLRTPDALHLACAQHHGCDGLWTNDGRMEQASHGLARAIAR